MHTSFNSGPSGSKKDTRVDIVSAVASSAEKSLLIVNSRPLERECLAQALKGHQLGLNVLDYGSVEEWRPVQDQHPPLAAVLYNLGSRKVTETDETNKIVKLTAQLGKVPVVILADSDDLTQVLKALEIGARGYIATSVDIGICAEAIKLAVVGGVFIPASSALAVKHLIQTSDNFRELSDMFTQRQSQVVNALRKGKANKIIAYELELRESTVKVHIRNIMKKLNATNRTEVVYKINDIYPLEKPKIGSSPAIDLAAISPLRSMALPR
jgi:DNA-binding NarL/FixJ family response regulator